jgi:hypothetical protein
MTNFILIPPPDYASDLLRGAPQFATSIVYRSLEDRARNMAGLVFAAFTRFMEGWVGNQSITDECAHAIEHFASSNDPEAHNLIITEVFENFQCPDISRKLLRPMSRALYDQWIGVEEGEKEKEGGEKGTS